MKLDFCPKCFINTTEDVCPYCGFKIGELETSAAVLKPGTIIDNRYKIGAILGIGGFGITYMGFNLQTRIRYAIKEYMPKDIALRRSDGYVEVNSKKNEEMYRDGLNLFLKETNILIELSGDNGVVQAYDFVTANNTGYLVMEYIDGVSVKKMMSAYGGYLTPSLAYEFFIKTALALQSVHRKGLLHRDISPDNIMVLKDQSIKLIDFGASRFFIGEKSKSLALILKPGYAPPEQYSSSRNQGEWTDIYALAATYYKMLTGSTPPDALARGSGQDTVERLDNLFPEIDARTGKAIKKALAINFRERYQSIDELLKDLRYEEVRPTDRIPEGTPGKSYTLWERITRRDKKDRIDDTPPPPPPPDQTQPVVRIVSGSALIGQWNLVPDTTFNVGRDSAQSNILILDSQISRVHLTIEYSTSQGCFIITDLSSNGTYACNGARLQKGVKYSIGVGEAVFLASPDFVMEVNLS